MGLDIRQRILKNHPAREVEQLVVGDDFSPPVQIREAWCFFDVPAAAAVAGGAVYYPPKYGAEVCFAHCGVDVGASPWRCGLREISDIALSSQAGSQRIINVYGSNYAIAGQWEAFQFFGIGDMSGSMAQGTPLVFGSGRGIRVFPPNIFILALVGSNLGAEGAIWVREYDGETPP